MPSLALAIPPAYVSYDTFERTSRASSRSRDWEKQRSAEDNETSQFVHNSHVIEAMVRTIRLFSELSANWNSYGAPAPSEGARNSAVAVLRTLQMSFAIPEKVMPSADGGVAIVFVGGEENRAAIEVFGTEDDYVLLYDTEGRSKTLNWPNDRQLQGKVIIALEAHLRGSLIATLG